MTKGGNAIFETSKQGKGKVRIVMPIGMLAGKSATSQNHTQELTRPLVYFLPQIDELALNR